MQHYNGALYIQNIVNQWIAYTCMPDTPVTKLPPIATALHLTTVVFACNQCDDNMRSVHPLQAILEYPYTTCIQCLCLHCLQMQKLQRIHTYICSFLL